jgi:serine/threonine-protein kinase HipA
MSSERVDVVVILDAPELGPPRPVGVLTRWPGRILSVAFAYARSWLDDTERHFAVDPTLPLTEAQYTVPGRRLPGIFADTAPDKWGEALMIRRARGRHLDDWEFLVGVPDETRMGALRLRRGVDGPYVADQVTHVPPYRRLRELQTLARAFEDNPTGTSIPDLEVLVAPGSSLGGARPKANYLAPDGSLWIAKFPSRTDRRDVSAWEHIYSSMAANAGVDVAETELLTIVGPERTFATRRFDRTASGRRLYASALTLTGRMDTIGADYIEIAEAIADHGAPDLMRQDLMQLYRRMAFNVLAGNRDDHLRNHGFLRHPGGWRLAPAFDLNPAREMREHATAINGVAANPTVSSWRELATATGIEQMEQESVAVAMSALDTAAAI